MVQRALRFVGDMASEHILRGISDRLQADALSELSNEQVAFNKHIRLAQKALGIVCPPAGTAMVLLEHGPVIAAHVIQRFRNSNV